MRTALRLLSLGAVGLLLGCAAEDAAAPGNSANLAGGKGAGADRLVVMSQNYYVGADVDAILAALLGGGDLATVLTEQVQVLQNTDFHRRAGALADLLAQKRPHAVGLAEVSTIVINIPMLGLNYSIDFLPVLTDTLTARGLPYAVAGQVTNFTVSAPLPPGVQGTVSLTDKDVLLIDASRVAVVGTVTAKTFSANLPPIPVPGTNLTVTLARGFVMAPLMVNDDVYLVATTHLEDDLGPMDLSGLRYWQMYEAVATADAYGVPKAVIMGDMNDNEGSLMYNVATGAGFSDLWRTLRPGTTGFTCCQFSDLSNPRPDLNQRIDFIFARGFEGPPGRAMGQIDRVNYNPSDKFAGPSYPIWMSDHAGLLGTLLMP